MASQERTQSALLDEVDRLRRRVAELEAAAKSTAENEELAIFRKFAEASGLGFSMADLDGRLTYLNPALCRMLGYHSPDEMLGTHLSACYTDEANQKGKEEIEPVLRRDGYWEGELPMLSRNGTVLTTWHNSFLIRDEQGAPLQMAVVIRDITERKQANETLRQSLDELHVIYESLGKGLVIAEIETLKVIRVNTSFSKMLGYSQEELLSMSIEAFHPKEVLPALIGPLREESRQQLPDFHDVPMVRKDGSIFYADISGNKLVYQGRSCSLALLQDVTERHKTHAALERERRTLKYMLQASDHERQLIAYEIHDGLAQQLAGAIMQFQIFDHLRDLKPREALSAHEGGFVLVKQSHFEARRLISGVRPPIIDESGVVAAITHLVNEAGFDQGPEVQFQSKVRFSRLPSVVENVVYRIVQEGLANASKHSKSKTVCVDLIQRGDKLRIHIRDDGIGFDPKTVPDDRFGLQGIRERARLLGGKCRIRSHLGEGTTIDVELPLAELLKQ